VQRLSSEIKLRIRTAPGMTIYPNISPSWTWSRIAEETPILIIAPTGGRPVSGSDTGIGRSRDLRMGGLGHLGWSGDVAAEVTVDTGDSVGQWWTTLHIHTQGQG